ncbi:hypothetical protein F4781DRAFT_399075 [Annulohypoxylon bovei var. microspora]|nr:hypothetical protein F4781DRAFT_399075 [Annulohypoxylon bovei var. microspora]
MPGPQLPSPEEVSWMLERPEDNLVPNIIACNTVAAFTATVFIILRLWSRHIQHGRIQLAASDWFAVGAWGCFIGYTVFAALGTRYGLGRHVVFASNARLLTIVNIVGENFYALVIALLKFSILSLYRTIFSSTRWFKRLTWALTALVAELAVQIIISTNVQCIPTARLWEPTLPGKCIEYGTQALVAYIINIVTDIIIITMPIPLIRSLKVNKRKQWGLIFAFAAGGSSCIVSIVQLKYIRKFSGTADSSWEMVPSSLLATIECMTGFIATSIATYGPLYRHIFKTSDPSSRNASDEFGPSRHLQRHNDDGYNVQISTGLASGDHNSTSSWHRGIMITDRIELTRHDTVNNSWVNVPESLEFSPNGITSNSTGR